jgi:ribosomal protein S18 acetylase RimI-like enzyme
MKEVVELKNGEKIIVRHVIESDIDGIWNNFNEVVNEKIYLPVLFPVRSKFEKQSWFHNIQKEREICIVAIHPKLESPHNILGQCEISNLEWDAAIHVGSLGLIVQKNFRDLGIGFILIDKAIRESKKLYHKEKIILSTFSDNKRALYLYEKMGFKTAGIRKKQFYMDLNYYDEVMMELWIDDYLNKNP